MGPRGTVVRIYKEDHYHCYTQNRKALCLVVSEKNIFLCFSHCKFMGANDLGAGPFLTPGAWLARFIKTTTTQCNIQNMKALGLVVFEKKIFYGCPIMPPGRGLYRPQGHRWQDL